MTGVMEGVRILEVAEHTFTPLAAGILSDWGATVTKIEHVERGDAMRGLGSTGGLQVGGGGVHMFMEHWLGFWARSGIADERFDSHEHLQANSGAARKLVSAEFAQDTFENWKLRLKDLKGQWSPVQDTVNIADDPMVKENGYLLETVSHDGIPFTMVSTPVMFDKEKRAPGRAPAFNEHGDGILARELGLDEEAIIALKAAGVVA